jgi:hypothetical protein
MEKLADQRPARRMALHPQLLRKPARALERPTQRRFRVPASERLDQGLKSRSQAGIADLGALAARSRGTDTLRFQSSAELGLLHPTNDRAVAQPCNALHRSDAATACCQRLGPCPQAQGPLVHRPTLRFVALAHRHRVHHI